MTLYMRLRLAHGLAWRTSHPPIPWRYLLAIIAIAILVALAGALDYQIAKAAELEQLADSNAGLAQVVIDCLNGASGYFWRDANMAFSCGVKL